jgi:hypothetical protein
MSLARRSDVSIVARQVTGVTHRTPRARNRATGMRSTEGSAIRSLLRHSPGMDLAMITETVLQRQSCPVKDSGNLHRAGADQPMRHAVPALLFVIPLLVLATPAQGQTDPAVREGNLVRVTLQPDRAGQRRHQELRGTVVAISADTIRLRIHEYVDPVVVPTGWISRLQVSLGPASRWQAASEGRRAASWSERPSAQWWARRSPRLPTSPFFVQSWSGPPPTGCRSVQPAPPCERCILGTAGARSL